MEQYINNGNNLSDITYVSELIPPSCFRKKAGGINSHSDLYSLRSISRVLIKKTLDKNNLFCIII